MWIFIFHNIFCIFRDFPFLFTDFTLSKKWWNWRYLDKVNQDGGVRLAICTSSMLRVWRPRGSELPLGVEALGKKEVRTNTEFTLDYGMPRRDGIRSISPPPCICSIWTFCPKVLSRFSQPGANLRSNPPHADLCCLSNPARCPEPITQLAQIEISY